MLLDLIVFATLIGFGGWHQTDVWNRWQKPARWWIEV